MAYSAPSQVVIRGPEPPAYAGPPPNPPSAVPVTAVTTMGGTVIFTPQMGPKSTRVYCASCRQEVVTKTKSKPSIRTHLFGAFFCLTLLWPCIFLPYCMESCMNTEHYCPDCNSYIGVHMN